MKKYKYILLFFLILAISFLIYSCSKESNDVIIHKIFLSTNSEKNAIELYNPTAKDINLNIYKIVALERKEININGKRKKLQEKLKGSIKSKGFYFITFTTDDEIINKKEFNLNIKKNITGGRIFLLSKNDKPIDVVGQAEFNAFNNSTYVRINEYQKATTKFDEANFILYKPEYFEIKGKLSPLSKKEILKGPKFNPESLNLEFQNGSKIGLGGSEKAEITQRLDGDTTKFKTKTYPSGDMSYRYKFVDTPESTIQGGQQAFGGQASYFTNYYLDKFKNDVKVQSVKDGSTDGSFGRSFALIWVGDNLINFLIAKEGFTDVSLKETEGINELSSYKNIPYQYYCYMAFVDAQKNKRGKFSTKKDKYFDYKKKEFIRDKDNHIPDCLLNK